MTPPQLSIALKEWDSVCRALEDGRQILLLRKGGIHESAGEFEPDHPTFILFPTFLHQNLAMLKPSEHAGFTARAAAPAKVTLSAVGPVTDILRLQSRSQMDALDDQHIWTPPLIDMRFNYRPANPLYLLLVRAYRLATPTTVDNTPAYAGCKSWVPLDRPVDATVSSPAITDDEYERRRSLIRGRLGD